jgi:hypothetical protein
VIDGVECKIHFFAILLWACPIQTRCL